MPQQKNKMRIPRFAELTSAGARILFWFYAYPERDFTFNEICRATGTSKTVAKQVIEAFLKKEFITRTVLGKLWRLATRAESEEFRRTKIAFNLQQIYSSGIVETIKKVYPSLRAIILFGSFRKGDDISTSDLDIAIELPGNFELNIEDFQKIKVGYRENVQVRLHFFCRRKIDLNVFANITNGIVLDGFLEVKP